MADARSDDGLGMTAGTGRGTGEPGAAWAARRRELAAWTLRIRVRDDAQGSHYWGEDEKTGNSVVKRFVCYKGLDLDTLAQHFAATSAEEVKGLHVADADEHCLVAVVDIDNHADDPALVAINRDYALAVHGEALALGLAALLLDGNGKGSYHIWVLLGRRTPMRLAYVLCRWLTRGWAEAGLPKAPDRFPTRPSHGSEKRMGPWVRLPGRHHKRDVWSRVWDPGRETWAEEEEAVALILATAPVPIDVEAALPAGFDPDPRPDRHSRGAIPEDAASDTGPFERRRLRLLVEQALWEIDGDAIEDYDQWLTIGMALKGMGRDGLELWHEWSSPSRRYRARVLDAKWATFADGEDVGRARRAGVRGLVTLGTIFHLAAQAGWSAPWDPAGEGPTRDEARDFRFSRECDEAIARLAGRPESAAALAARWRVPTSVLGLLGIGHREDPTRSGDDWVGTGRWAWTAPLSSSTRQTIGYVRIYEDPAIEDRLAHGGRPGLILPLDHHERRDGPIVVCRGAAEAAAGLALGACAVGLSGPGTLDDLVDLVDWWRRRDVVVAPHPAADGRHLADAIVRRVSVDVPGCSVRALDLPAGLAGLLAEQSSKNKEEEADDE
jgi:Primase C terminal 2 (PriCT-2)